MTTEKELAKLREVQEKVQDRLAKAVRVSEDQAVGIDSLRGHVIEAIQMLDEPQPPRMTPEQELDALQYARRAAVQRLDDALTVLKAYAIQKMLSKASAQSVERIIDDAIEYLELRKYEP